MTGRWDEAKQKLVKATVDKEAAKLAKKLGALSCLVIGFFVDPMDAEVIHMSVGGQSPYPPHTVFGRLAELNRGSEQNEILENRVRSKTKLAARLKGSTSGS
jgi:hypothetical protein